MPRLMGILEVEMNKIILQLVLQQLLRIPVQVLAAFSTPNVPI